MEEKQTDSGAAEAPLGSAARLSMDCSRSRKRASSGSRNLHLELRKLGCTAQDYQRNERANSLMLPSSSVPKRMKER